MSKVEEGDLSPEQKVAKTFEEYKEITAEVLEKSGAEFLEYIAEEENFHRVGEFRGALIQEIEKYKTDSPERARLAPLLSAANARYKKLKPKPKMAFGDTDYLEVKKKKTI